MIQYDTLRCDTSLFGLFFGYTRREGAKEGKVRISSVRPYTNFVMYRSSGAEPAAVSVAVVRFMDYPFFFPGSLRLFVAFSDGFLTVCESFVCL